MTDPVFHVPLAAALEDSDFRAKLKDRELSFQLVPTDGTDPVFVDADGIRIGETPYRPVLRLELNAETAAALWRRELTVTRAVVARRLVIKGPVNRVGQFAELIHAKGIEEK